MTSETVSATKTIPTAKVGDGATISGYSDRHAATVIAVSKSGTIITLQEDTATLLNGPTSGEPDALQFSPGGFVGHTSGTQRYSYAPNPTGAIRRFSLRTLRDGSTRWIEVGQSTKGGTRAAVNGRHHHYDFNF